MPCSGTFNRNELYDLLCDDWFWRVKYPTCNCIIGGDFNVDLDGVNAFSTTVNNFISNRSLSRCDLTFPTATKYTYDAPNCQNIINYFLIADISKVCQFDIIDHHSNSSDHVPLHCVCKTAVSLSTRPGKMTILIAKFT